MGVVNTVTRTFSGPSDHLEQVQGEDTIKLKVCAHAVILVILLFIALLFIECNSLLQFACLASACLLACSIFLRYSPFIGSPKKLEKERN